jgi:hypothetical protein
MHRIIGKLASTRGYWKLGVKPLTDILKQSAKSEYEAQQGDQNPRTAEHR